MSEERLKEIRSNINYLSGLDYDVKDEVELYDEVIRLREIIDKLDAWAKEYSEKDTASSIIFGVVVNHLQELKEGK